MDELTLPLVIAVVAGLGFVALIVFRLRGIASSVRSLAEALQDLARGRRRRPTGPSLPTDERFRDVGDDRPRDGRPDPYA